MRVGFIGLGNMGGAQARLIAAKGFDLSVFDATEAAMAGFAGKARLALSPADASADADVVGVCVRDDAQVEDVISGAGGVLEGIREGTLILVHSTIRPDTVKRLALLAERRGVGLIDAAVTRSEMAGEGPFVFTMTGGDAALTDRARPVLDCYSTDVLRAGPLGAGMAVKIANNAVTWVQLMIGWQAFRIAEAAGVAAEQLEAVMRRNGNLTPAMGAFVKGQRERTFGGAADYAALMASQVGIGEKDVSLAIEFAESKGIAMPLANAAKGLIHEALTGHPRS